MSGSCRRSDAVNAFRCPDETAWSEFLADDLFDPGEHELSEHLLRCQDCRQLLEDLTTLARPSVEPADSETADFHTPRFRALKRRMQRLVGTADTEIDTLAYAEARARRELPER